MTGDAAWRCGYLNFTFIKRKPVLERDLVKADGCVTMDAVITNSQVDFGREYAVEVKCGALDTCGNTPAGADGE